VKFVAAPNQEVMLFFASQSGGAAVHAKLTDSTGIVTYLDVAPSGLGASLTARWKAPASGGTFYLELSSMDPRVWGDDVRYLLYIGDPHLFFLPFIGQ
jgi:hypothetical protein